MATIPLPKQIMVLLVEDDPDDMVLLRDALSDDLPAAFRLTTVSRLSQAFEILHQQAFDIVLLDLGLPDSQGLETLESFQKQSFDIPTIVLSGRLDEAIAVQAVQNGAQDYLVKGESSRNVIGRALRYAIERHQTQALLRASEQRFRALIEHNADAIALFGANGAMLYVSPASKNILGYGNTDEVEGSVLDYVHPEDRSRVEGMFQVAMDSPRKPIQGQFRVRHENGAWRWVEVTGTNLLDEPSVAAIVVNYRDVTERRQAIEAIQESEGRYRSLVEVTPDAIFIVQEDQIIFANQGSLTMLGTNDSAQLLGRHLLDFVPPDLKEAVRRRIENMLATLEKTPLVEERMLRLDGAEIPVEVVATPMLYDGVLSIQVVVRDLSERRKAQSALLESQQRLNLAISATQMGVWEWDMQTDAAFWSRECCVIAGIPDMSQTLDAFRQIVDPEDYRQILVILDQAIVSHEPFSSEFHIRRPSGEARWISVFGQIHFSESGEPLRVVGAALDITARKRAEIERQALLEITQGVTQTDDLAEFLGIVHRSIGKVIYAENFFVLLQNPNTGAFEEAYTADQFEEPLTPELLEKSISAYIFRSGEALLLNATPEGMYETNGKFELVGKPSSAWMGVPLKTARDIIGVIAVQDYNDPNRYSRSDLEFLTSIAGQVAVSVDRKRAESQLARLSRQMELILGSAGEGIYGTDSQGNVIFINPVMADLVGWKAEEILGKCMHDLCHHSREDIQFFPWEKCPICLASQNRESHYSDSEQYWRKDGSSFPVEYTSTPMVEGQEVIGTVVVVKDISERRKAEREARLRAQRAEGLAHISQMFALLPGGYYEALEPLAQLITELFGDACTVRLISADESTLEMAAAYHADPQAMRQLQAIEASSPFLVKNSFLEHLIETGASFEIIHRAQEAPDNPTARVFYEWMGQYHIDRALFAPMQAQGQIAGMLMILVNEARPALTDDDLRFLSDIADRSALAIISARLFEQVQRQNAELEQRVTERTTELRYANSELERAARAKDDFLASMSHELRTPLNAILTLTESLEEGIYGPVNSQQSKPLRTVAESGYHLLNLINDILDLSRIEAGKLELQIGEIDVELSCQSSLRLVKQLAQKKRQTVTLQIDPAVTRIDADARCLKQMLVNLLSNAIKFTPENGEIGLEVTGDASQGVVNFSVWDTGIGIAPEHIQKLFRPFVQVDSGLSRQYGGTGLGLSLVYRMAEMHGGSVSLQSVPGEGSRFTISLPWDRGDSIKGAFQIPDHAPRIQRAMVIEDAPHVAEQLARYLNELGAQVTVCAEGEAALMSAVEIQPEVILLDSQLPGLSGQEVMAALKADARTRSIPVVVVTALDYRSEKRPQGAVDVVLKPVTRSRLYEALWKGLTSVNAPAPRGLAAAEQLPVILLAEDNLANQTTFSDYLSSKGYRMLLAGNGDEAIQQAREQTPDLVLMDIQMPGMDGLEAMRRLRTQPTMRDVPMLALTALAMPGDRERCLAAGANDYLTKPINLKQLLKTIESYLQRKSA